MGPIPRPTDDLSRIALGGAALGGLYTHVEEADAQGVVAAALAHGLTYVDTAPLYGHGTSEARIGRALQGVPRESYRISTKVGRLIEATTPEQSEHDMFADAPPTRVLRDFSEDGVRRSLESSLDRLGTDHIDIVYVHDPEDHMEEAVARAMPALLRLRDEGVVGAVGVGTNFPHVAERFLAETDLDVVLLAGRWTLLDRSGLALLDSCVERRTPVVLGGIMNSGLLADPERNTTFDYAPAPRRIVDVAQAMQIACERRDVLLRDAAVQHALRHPAVTSVLVGCRTPPEVAAAAAATSAVVDEALWAELDRLAQPLGLVEHA